MSNEISNSELKLAEDMANDIRENIHSHHFESGIPGGYIKASVLVPMTENINMSFEIDVPYEMMDEDNTALLEYFLQHIYKPENGSYMTEAVNTLIAEKEMVLQRLQENLDNFDADAFMRGDYDSFNEDYSNAPWNEYLPENVDSTTFFAEMAEIYPKYIQDKRPKIKFRVIIAQGGEGKVPHMHMYFRSKEDKNQKYISYISLHKAEYAPQHKDGKKLNSSEKKALIEFLTTFRKGAFTTDKDGNPIPCNCWQECVDTWISTYGDEGNLFEQGDDGMIIMPDYSKL